MKHAPSGIERKSACDRILDLLARGAATSLDVQRVGGLNYRARISDLRERGHRIECVAHPTLKGVNIYRLKPGQGELFT